MVSKGFLAVFWGIFCCTQGVRITYIKDYCTKKNDRKYQCEGLNFGATKEVEFTIGNYLEAEELYFTDSNLFTIPKNAFRISKPVTQFTMDNCSLREIYRHNFHNSGNNTSTKELSLIYNYIERIPGRAFELLLKLRTLILSKNTITTLDADCFVGLPNVVSLYLDKNNLRALPHNILEPLKNLQQIYLQGNKLEYLPRTIFSTNKELREMNLANNNLKIIDVSVVTDPSALQYVLQHFNQSFQSTNIDVGNHAPLWNWDLSHNYVPYISRHSIPKAVVLTDFIADNCHLTTVESGAFSSQTNLRKLVLSNNELQSFDLNQLSTIKGLEQIDFRSNNLTEFEFRLLAANNKLKWVYLKGNPFPCKLNNEIVQFFKKKSRVDLEEVSCP